MNLSKSEVLPAANASPDKSRAGSQGDLGVRNASPVVEPRKLSSGGHVKKSGLWDAFFQYDITYQKSKK